MRITAFASILCALALLFLGCNIQGPSSGGSTGSPPTDSTYGETVTLNFLTAIDSDEEIRYLEETLEESTNPSQIEPEFEFRGGYPRVLSERLHFGDGLPDVFTLQSPGWVKYSESLLPLGEYFNSKFNRDDFYPEALKLFENNKGELHGIPRGMYTYSIMYDSDKLEQIPELWDDFVGLLEQNREDAPESYGFCIPNSFYLWLILYYQRDQSLRSYSEEHGKLAAEQLRSLIESGIAVVDDNLSMSCVNAVLNGHAASTMVLQYPFDDNVDRFKTTELPPRTLDGKVTLMFVDGYVISRQTQHPNNAWELVSYLADSEIVEGWTNVTNARPVYKEVARGQVQAAPYLAPFVAGAEYAKGSELSLLPEDTILQSMIAATDSLAAGEITGVQFAEEMGEYAASLK